MSTQHPYNRHRTQKALYNILMVAGISGMFMGISYAFFHLAGGNLVIPDHFKTDVFDPNESVVHEVIKHRTAIILYWISQGFLIGFAAFAGLAMVGVAGQVLLGKFNTHH